jgi:hypothetical protein
MNRPGLSSEAAQFEGALHNGPHRPREAAQVRRRYTRAAPAERSGANEGALHNVPHLPSEAAQLRGALHNVPHSKRGKRRGATKRRQGRRNPAQAWGIFVQLSSGEAKEKNPTPRPPTRSGQGVRSQGVFLKVLPLPASGRGPGGWVAFFIARSAFAFTGGANCGKGVQRAVARLPAACPPRFRGRVCAAF